MISGTRENPDRFWEARTGWGARALERNTYPVAVPQPVRVHGLWNLWAQIQARREAEHDIS